MLTRIIASISILSATLPVPISAQTVAPLSEDSLAAACNNFDWLLGTWQSYSPWGNQTDPTGGTLVFTLDGGGTVVGRIGTLNSYMEESGYAEGMQVYRGFRDVRNYGPDGTTRFESFGGEYLQVYDGVSEWREESIGVRQNGELYMSPPATAHLSGRGPFRKGSDTQTRQSGDVFDFSNACAPPASQSGPFTSTERPEPSREMVDRLLDPRNRPPPILLNPLSSQEDDCMAVQGVRNDVQNLYGRMTLDETLANLEGLKQRLADPDLEDYQRETFQRNFDRYDNQMRTEMVGLFAAQLMETDPKLVESYAQRAASIAASYARMDAVTPGEAPDADYTPVIDDRCGFEYKPILVDLDKDGPPLTPSDDACLQIQSIRNDVQDLGGQVGLTLDGPMDVGTKLANLNSIYYHLGGLDANDPTREAFERNYRRLHYELEQERSGLNYALGTEQLDIAASADELDAYNARYTQIREGMDSLPTPRQLESRDAPYGGFTLPEDYYRSIGLDHAPRSAIYDRLIDAAMNSQPYSRYTTDFPTESGAVDAALVDESSDPYINGTLTDEQIGALSEYWTKDTEALKRLRSLVPNILESMSEDVSPQNCPQ